MRILFCSDPLNGKSVDPDYLHEYECAHQLGLEVHLLSLEDALDGAYARAARQIPVLDTPETFVYRGWMMKPEVYAGLYAELLRRGAILINTAEQYRNGHYFPYAYEAIREATPRSVWVEEAELDEGLEAVYERMNVFGAGPVLIKDYVKSRKHEWEEACWIPDASDRQRTMNVLRNFIDRQGTELSGGLVIREFVPLEQLAVHPKSGMPLSNEYRLFFLHHRLIADAAYWDEAEYEQEMPDLSRFTELAQKLDSAFFTMDIARTATGGWTVIEAGDGQVSGLPGQTDLERFYRALMEGAERV